MGLNDYFESIRAEFQVSRISIASGYPGHADNFYIVKYFNIFYPSRLRMKHIVHTGGDIIY